MWWSAARLQYSKFSYSFKVTVHQIFIQLLLIKASSLAFRLTPIVITVLAETMMWYSTYCFEVAVHQFFGRVITHQTLPSSLYVLLPSSSGVRCNVCDAFICEHFHCSQGSILLYSTCIYIYTSTDPSWCLAANCVSSEMAVGGSNSEKHRVCCTTDVVSPVL